MYIHRERKRERGREYYVVAPLGHPFREEDDDGLDDGMEMTQQASTSGFLSAMMIAKKLSKKADELWNERSDALGRTPLVAHSRDNTLLPNTEARLCALDETRQPAPGEAGRRNTVPPPVSTEKGGDKRPSGRRKRGPDTPSTAGFAKSPPALQEPFSPPAP